MAGTDNGGTTSRWYRRGAPLVVAGLLLLVLLLAAHLRLTGVDWDDGQHLHPDERFLTMVALSLEPVPSLGDYLDTASSTLNPRNQGSRPHYVYGTFPVILTRYLAGWLDADSYRQLHLVGRRLSAAADLLVVLLVFVAGRRIGGNRLGLLAAAFSGLAVLQIQLSHFFIVDTFANLCCFAAITVALFLATTGCRRPLTPLGLLREPVLLCSLLFGLASGAAVAAKLNTAPVVVLLPAALLLHARVRRSAGEEPRRSAGLLTACLLAGAVVSLLAFRLLQPYAFTGPGLFDLRPSADWLETLQVLAAQSGPDADSPPALQWARRPPWFAGRQLVLWGLGPALGLLAWTGIAVAGWRLVTRRDRRLLLPWVWVAGYFSWQSLANNPTMRYQLPVYPLLALFAAWLVLELWQRDTGGSAAGLTKIWRAGAVILGGGTLLASGIWAFAFTSIYTRPVTRVAASQWLLAHAPGPLNLQISGAEGSRQQPLPLRGDALLSARSPVVVQTAVRNSGELHAVTLPQVHDMAVGEQPQRLVLGVYRGGNLVEPTVRAACVVGGGHGDSCRFALEPPPELQQGERLTLAVTLEEGNGVLRLRGAGIANESSWDDGLPLRVDGFDPFGGLYRGDLNLELYWPDNQEKLERFSAVLDDADYLVISSSRQWGSTTRLPERYPLTCTYYRALLGCPSGQGIEDCFNRARVGSFQGRLGFDLVHVAQSDPRIGPWTINDQGAEEAFTVYDHPKVLIFEKTDRYDPAVVQEILGSVDLSRVLPVRPGRAGSRPLDLLLPAQRLAEQRAGGTWSELFDRSSLLNRSPLLLVVSWYLVVALLGLIAFPLVRLVLPGLPDRGYGLSRVAGLVLVTWLVWLAGSCGVPFSRLSSSLAVLAVLGVSLLLVLRGRQTLRAEWRQLRDRVLAVEIIMLVLFAAGLLLRYYNPDLWHPYRGGEKPMELAYLSAVLRSTSFPPYDPWFSGGYLNYYYYGWLLVGLPVRWLGIVPTVAFNLIVPTLLAVTGSGAFSVSSGLLAAAGRLRRRVLLAGLAALLGMVVIGNLGSLQMLVAGCQRLGSQDVVADAGLLTRSWWTVWGLGKALAGSELPFHTGEWYWNPTRIIPDPEVQPITEFPSFSFLFADLHPHLLDLPLTLLVLAWVLSLLRWRPPPALARGSLQLAGLLLAGGLVIGALRPTNTWSFYPYLLLAALVTGIVVWRWRREDTAQAPAATLLGTVLSVALAVGLLWLLAHLLYQPYASWYGAGYTEVERWRGAHTPLSAYLLHWGLFLLVAASWLVVETRAWRAAPERPAVQPLQLVIAGAGLVAMVVLLLLGVTVAWVAVPLLSWAGVLLLLPGQTNEKRLALFLLGTALAMTLTVELVVLRGDIGRMNTVFKLCLQAWTMLAVACGAATGWLLPVLWQRRSWLSRIWLLVLAAVLTGTLLYPALAVPDRLRDRMAADTPHTLDGAAYMEHAVYHDFDTALPLAEDLRAIRWLQENVQGSPVIVEAHTVEYHWGSRCSIYTGLPTVIGWNWHQRQQRSVVPHEWVWRRVHAVRDFYTTGDAVEARRFLERYDVSYLIVGRLERAAYPGPGLDKFPQLDGRLWRSVYEDGATTIYQTMAADRSPE